ncbi:MAG: methionine biosynthesis protein MetW [Gaiellales bacterium]
MRPDLDVVAGLVPTGSKVLDLGCGDGTLLAHLYRSRGCEGAGVEIRGDDVIACIERGVPVIEADLDEGLADFDDASFDIVVVSQTLQATRQPLLVLREVMRVGRRGIVSIPNFGHWRLRADLCLRGRMPSSPALPHAWYDTPNIHLATITDLERLLAREGIRTLARVLLGVDGRSAGAVCSLSPNLAAAGAVYLLER